MSDRTVQTNRLGMCQALTLLFIALKLCGVIAWSWVWVLAPLWIPLSILLLIICVGLIGYGVVALMEWRESR